MKSYNVAMYLRLSREDNAQKSESESIKSQRDMICSFLDEKTDFISQSLTEFKDDGYSGTNDRRPAFAEMIEQIRASKIDLIIVKDLSRFFRDYIEAGNYLECVFPFFKVRFISINDHYDSEETSMGGIEIAMRNIIYASYSKDLSTKTVSARKHMMKQGKFVGSHAPFGYKMHPKIKNKLAIDSESAKIVRKIFKLALQGNKTSKIAKKLNKDKVMTPAKYYKYKFPDDKKFNYTSEKSVWTSAQVYLILTNLRYTGTLVSNRKEKVSVSENKYRRAEPIIVEGTHEAIVSKENFDKANLVIKKTGRTSPTVAKEYPLKSLVRCGNCKRLMAREMKADKEFYFTCSYSHSDDDNACIKAKSFTQTELEERVLKVINDTVKKANEQILVFDKKIAEQNKIKAEIAKMQDKIKALSKSEFLLYQNYTNNIIDKKEFIKQEKAIERKLQRLKLQCEDKQEQIKNLISIPTELLRLRGVKNVKTLDYEIAHTVIKGIYIVSPEKVDIKLKFENLRN
ncbi:MAG: recombinase family protein [Clostridia bacterium]